MTWQPQLTLNDGFSNVQCRLRTLMKVHFETRQIIVYIQLRLIGVRDSAYHLLKLTCCGIKHQIAQRGYWIFSLFSFDVGCYFHLNERDFLGRKCTLIFKNRLLNQRHFVTNILSRGLERSVGMCF